MMKVLRLAQALMTGRHWAITLIAIGFLATATVSEATAQTVTLECSNPALEEDMKIVIDYGRAVVEIYQGLKTEDQINTFKLIPPSMIEGDHVVHSASITDDYVEWSGGRLSDSGMFDTLLPSDVETVSEARIDRKTGAFSVVFGVPMNTPSPQVGTCTKRSDTNKF